MAGPPRVDVLEGAATHHSELRQVWLEGDARPVVGGFAGCDDRLALDGHVVAENLHMDGAHSSAHVSTRTQAQHLRGSTRLAVAPSSLAVAGFNDKLLAEDVGQLGAVAVAAAHNLGVRCQM